MKITFDHDETLNIVRKHLLRIGIDQGAIRPFAEAIGAGRFKLSLEIVDSNISDLSHWMTKEPNQMGWYGAALKCNDDKPGMWLFNGTGLMKQGNQAVSISLFSKFTKIPFDLDNLK